MKTISVMNQAPALGRGVQELRPPHSAFAVFHPLFIALLLVILPAASSAQAIVVATEVTSHSARLTWLAPIVSRDCIVAGYSVSHEGQGVDSDGGSGYLVTGLTPSTTYTFGVTAIFTLAFRPGRGPMYGVPCPPAFVGSVSFTTLPADTSSSGALHSDPVSSKKPEAANEDAGGQSDRNRAAHSDLQARLLLVHSEDELHRWNAASPEVKAKSGGTIDLHPGEQSMTFALVTGSGVSHHHLTAECMLLAPEPAEPLFDDHSKTIVAYGRYIFVPSFTPHPRFQRGWEDCLVETRTNRQFPNAAMLVLVRFSADRDMKSDPRVWKLSADYEIKPPATWNLQVHITDDSNEQNEMVEGQIAMLPDTPPDSRLGALQDIFAKRSAIEAIPSSKNPSVPTLQSEPSTRSTGPPIRWFNSQEQYSASDVRMKPWGVPLNEVEILGLLVAGESSQYLSQLIRKQGITFHLTPDFMQRVKAVGGEEVLHSALRSAVVARELEWSTFFEEFFDQKSLYQAYQLRKKRQLALAEKKLREVSTRSPVSEIAVGYILMQQSKYGEAEAQFRAAVEQWPDSPVAHSDLGVALFAEAIKKTVDNGYAASEDAASKAGASGIENMLADGYTGSEDIVSLWGQGEDGHVRTFLVDKQLLNTAIAEQRTANRLDPEYADAHGHLGEHLQWAGKDESGLNEIERAAKLDPTGWREARSRAYKRILLHVEVKNRE